MEYYEDLDFEDKYADEFEVLRDIEDDFAEPIENCRPNSRSSRDEIETKTRPNHVRNLLKSFVELGDSSSSQGIKRIFAETDDVATTTDPLQGLSKRMRMDDDLLSLDDYIEKDSFNNQLSINRIFMRSPQGNCISIQTTEGYKLYSKLRSDFNGKDICSSKKLQLLSVPIEDLRIQAEQIRERSQSKTVDKKATVLCATNDVAKALLWTEKFKPHTYLDLLSDDGTNRVLLRWLKLWDKVVFGQDVKVRSKVEQPKGKQHYHKHFNGNRFSQVNEELDAQSCPKQKVSLLCGPPGLGKTTLAHIIARHAGYNAVEMNASDDRSPEAFRTQIEAATQMRAVLGATPRPNCLIIDEIDGAPATAINVLMSMISDGSNTRKKGGKKKLLHRPVICICNDQYVPALRPLRQVALILNFPPTLATRLASRLLEISSHERLAADISSLLVLCEKANNDIRSCLSTLQFLYNKGKVLKVSDIQNLCIGQKDVQRSLFFVWQEIFQINSSLKTNTVNKFSESSERFNRILNTVQSFGDYDKIVNGIFENYLQMKTKNLQLNHVADSAEWLIFHDAINQEIQHNQSYLLMTYLPYCPIKFHMLFASHNYNKIAYPTAEYEMMTKLATSQNLIATMKNEMTPNTRAFALSQALILDILPLLISILQPSLRPVNTQLYTVREKEELEHLVDIMIAYNVTYRQELALDGTCQYVLEPKFHLVSQFSELDTTKQLTYAARQLVSREVELERLRRGEKSMNSLENISMRTSETKAKLQDGDVKLVPVEKKPASIVHKNVDFFGRPIQKLATEVTVPKENCSSKGNIWYHFKEGFSNAVRRNVRIQDLL